MKIGIDLDGVVIDSITTFRVYEEIYDINILKGNHLINKKEPKFQDRYSWTEEQQNRFIQEYFLKVGSESDLMPGFKVIYELLRKDGHKFVVITARGEPIKEMKDNAIQIFRKNNIEFDKYYWAIKDKLEVCQKENIDIMIDDEWQHIKRISENKIKTLYFRDTNMIKLNENEYIKEVNNWGDVYRYIKEQ